MPRMPSLIPDILSSPSSEGGGDDRRYVARARRDRRLKLASWDLRGLRTPDLSFVLGLSWRVHGCTSDVDLVGSLDVRRVAWSLPGVVWRWLRKRFEFTREKEKIGVVDEEGKRDGDGEGKEGQNKNPPIRVDPGVHNALHAPYLIMEFVEGIRLDEYWFAGTDAGTHGKTYTSYGADHVKLRRRRVLHSLARTMLRLGVCGTEQGGAPVIDEAAWRVLPGAAAPARHLDVRAMVCGWLDRSDGRGTEDERTPIYAAIWPHDDPREAYTAPLDRYPPATEAARGVDALLRLLIGMLREAGRTGGAEGEGEGAGTPPFVLAHPDLQLRHVIVSEDGEVTGIVGWDGVRAVPRSVGNEALPRWLVRDLNPFIYGWTPTAAAAGLGLVAAPSAQDKRGRSGPYPENPPWILAELRDAYVDIIRRLKREKAASGTGVRGATTRGDDQRDVDVTRQSLLALSLDEAVRDPRCRSAVLRRVLEKCSARFEEPLDYEFFVDVLGRGGRLDQYKVECLTSNFAELAGRGQGEQ
ncbi:hypothetical protein DL771_005761 [Monosporascus sp. 5C6A]|nr:hypothetical protein DL771_005761 [Monosporascus sp. 5C6A]